MIRRIKTYKIPLVLVISLFVFHLAQKDFNNPYERPVAGDAQAYYAYLPAIFVYQDLSYGFIDEINQKYYPESHRKSFLKPAGDGRVNKTFPGVALLYLPFFLLAHAMAQLFGLDADGYSTVYQVCFDLGLWVYLSLGLIALIEVLKKMGYSLLTSNIATAAVLLCSNMVFYTVYDQSVTHIYNFFLINLLLYTLLKFRENKTNGRIVLAFSLLALIGIIRPTNFLVLGLILFFIPDFSFYKSALQFCLTRKTLFSIIGAVTAIFSIPFILWKLQTGLWLVYSYGEEGFNFSDPHYTEFLFSYLKGWLLYSPFIALVFLIAFPLLYKKHRTRFFIGLSFYLIAIYIFSSWWCWYYGAGMGQRVMIDHYILLAFLVAMVVDYFREKAHLLTRITAAGIVGFLILLNFAQACQIRHGILTGGSATQTQYWENFLVLEKRARVYPHDHWKLEESWNFTLRPDAPEIVKGQSYPAEGERVIQVTADNGYSASIAIPSRSLRPGSKLIIGFEARARHEINQTRAVLDLDGAQHVFGLDPYLKKDEWVKVEFMTEPATIINDTVILYFWNGGSEEKVEFKNIRVFNYYSAEYL